MASCPIHDRFIGKLYYNIGTQYKNLITSNTSCCPERGERNYKSH